MKTYQFLSISLLLCSFIISCDEEEIKSNSLSIDLTETHLSISNQSSSDLFYMAAEQNTLALIDWAPGCSSENKIDAKKGTRLDVTAILGYDSTSTENVVVVTFWQGNENNCPSSRLFTTQAQIE